MAGALDGIRVIDFGQWLAGPLTALLLADQGAEVIHVDPPGGPAWKTVANATLQRGKQRTRLLYFGEYRMNSHLAMVGCCLANKVAKISIACCPSWSCSWA